MEWVKRKDTSDWPCTIARSVAVLGDHWNLLILREACLGTADSTTSRPFSVSAATSYHRLNGLVDPRPARRVEYQQRPPRHEYRLTDKGHDIYPSSPPWPPGAIAGSPARKAPHSCSTTPPVTTTCTPSSSAASAPRRRPRRACRTRTRCARTLRWRDPDARSHPPGCRTGDPALRRSSAPCRRRHAGTWREASG